MSEPRQKIAEAVANHTMSIVDMVTSRSGKPVESPIERVMLEALLAYGIVHHNKLPWLPDMLPRGATWKITPQFQCAPYRLDFMLEDLEYDVKVAIECDGHDFHERTKEQAARDRARDRELQSRGYLVLRFTGSELYRDPWKCADEVQMAIYAVDHRRFERDEKREKASAEVPFQ